MRAPRERNAEKEDAWILLPFEDLSATRRSFLRLAGFGIAAAALPGCARAPAAKATSWVQAQEGVVGGKAYSIATTCQGCTAGCGVLAKCRDGRPIKLEGNPEHPVSKGGLCAVGQASVLSLYDSLRFDGPRRKGAATSWDDADREIGAALAAARNGGGRVRLLTGTITSPSTRHWIETFVAGFADARHVSYDALGGSAILDAHAATHGRRVLPRYRFADAAVIASFEADFLGTWISPVEFAHGWAAARRPDAGRMSRHWQFEPCMSITGGCADERFRLAPWEMGKALAALRSAVADGSAISPEAPQSHALGRLAGELLRARGRSLVVCGSNDSGTQALVNEINEALGNYGKTLDLDRPSQQRQGNDEALADLLAELDAGAVDVLMVCGANPAYDLPGDAGKRLRRAKLLISAASLRDETADLADWICPEPHFLESWNDAEPVLGTLALTQPTVPPLRSARTLRETLARWSGERRGDRDLLTAFWREKVHPRFRNGGPFSRFFNKSLHDGFATIDREAPRAGAFRRGRGPAVPGLQAPNAGELVLVLYPKVALLDGRHAQNPWLQELPDPVSRLAWESYATLAPEAAIGAGIVEGDVIRIDAGEGAPSAELPVHVEPGQHPRVVGVALGYGRAGTDRFAGIGPDWLEGRRTVEPGGVIGVNAAPWLDLSGSGIRFDARRVRIARTGAKIELASVQDHRSLEVPDGLASKDHAERDVVKAATLESYRRLGPGALGGGHVPAAAGLWPKDHETTGHRWGMAVDLSACTGCSSCVVSCQAENNVPVVGRDEVRRHREMSWIRIDRYASGTGDDLAISRQPMMCQHCENAPCEAVCPVLATVHSSDGLNQQVYNRCVGTRYCANTCPYKVRRFNWFDYAHEDALENHALNPEVTVRSRGVMEKCSLCLQRIEEGRLEARRRGEPVRDGEIRTACQQSCPTRAIVFGDLADPESEVSKLARIGRSYRVLEELNVDPRVTYLARIRHTEAGA